MSEFKGTKGEWIIKETSTILETKIMCGEIRIAEVKHYNQGDDDWTKNDPVINEGKANAKLIACAPEMLEALKNLVFQVNQFTSGNIGEQDYFNDEIKEANRIIKKATE